MLIKPDRFISIRINANFGAFVQSYRVFIEFVKLSPKIRNL